MHKISYAGMKDFADKYANGNLKVLDVGSCVIGEERLCYRAINKDWEYVGCDIESGCNVNVVLQNPYKWDEFEDNEFDVVISGQALEHIEFPWLTVKEIARVVKPMGYVCIIAPAHCPVHKFPVDTFRYNEDGMVALAKWAGLEVVKVDSALWDYNPDMMCLDTRLIARKNDTTL